ncbi:MCP four helix bundle domain-containing protein [Acidovorax sp. DW039]|uniref:methyl-accepting chemotaxis protein n=1 Tax=Acidovorax sp. DW039 TaxID=3095606 RepID=UPI003086A21B|nr:MCP four helix bundle domain-containing protein [Acidovorax sp. DW039]
MKLGALLACGFAVVILLGFLIAAFSRYHLDEASKNVTALADDRMAKLQLLQDVKDNVNLVARALRNLALLSDMERMTVENQRLEKAIGDIASTMIELKKVIVLPADREKLMKLEQNQGAFFELTRKAAKLGLANEQEAATALLMGDMRTVQLAAYATLQELIDAQRKLVKEAAEETKSSVQSASATLLVLALVACGLGVVVALLITTTIKGQIGGEPAYAARIANEVANGNLSVSVDLRASDQSSILAAMSTMRSNLAQVVSQVRQSSESIATGASQIATGNADLSQRTEEQASNLQQTAASMEQMTSTVKQNADTVRTATQLASSASATADRGGSVVGDVVKTMEDITASSRRIGDIIGVIDSIAFQTNILALNAAVEAARAGEQGRGFAVVASEVRTLAQRSAQAAKEIKSLINESVSKVEAGSALVSQAGTTMGDIVEQTRRVADLIGEIGAATHEQGQGIAQVGSAINQLDQVTQQNAALVEESAAAADSLNNQAARLVQLVSVFQLDEHASHAVIEQAKHHSKAAAQVASVALTKAKAPAAGASAMRLTAETAPQAAAAPTSRPATRQQSKPLPSAKPRAALVSVPNGKDADEWESF